MVGGLLGGLMVELLSLGAEPATDKPARRGITGIQNVSLSVVDLDDTHRRIREAGYTPEQDPFEIGGVRMFFVKDPDGTPVEFIELPGGVRSTYEMHRGVPLRMGRRSELHPPRLDARPRRDHHRRRPGRRQRHRRRVARTWGSGAAGRHSRREAGRDHR